MSRQDVLHQGDGFTGGFFPQLLGKVEFGSQEVAHWPQPLLQTHADDSLVSPLAAGGPSGPA